MAFGLLTGTAGIQPGFLAQLEQLRRIMPNNLGAQISVGSGYRSPERQRFLFDRAVKKYGSVAAARKWVAPPGHSQHNRGNAVDLHFASPEAMRAAHQYAAQAGLVFPMSYENWHIEPIGARNGKSAPAAPAGQAADLSGAVPAGTAAPAAPTTPESSVADLLASAAGGDDAAGAGLPSLGAGGGGGGPGLVVGPSSPPSYDLQTMPASPPPEAAPTAAAPGTDLSQLAGLFTLPTIGKANAAPADLLPGGLPGQAKPFGRKVWK